MYHTYPYKAQVPILIEGTYETRMFTSKEDIMSVVSLLVKEVKESNQKGNGFNIGESVMSQLPFFACKNVMIDIDANRDISRFVYSRDFNVPAYSGSYGNQPKRWIEKTFLLNNLIERQKSKVMNNGKK